MRRSGAATRSMGRRMSEASPIRLDAKGSAASSPIIRRIAVPALPMSSGAPAALRPRAPAPCTRTSPAPRPLDAHPEGLEGPRGRKAVLPGEKAADVGHPLRQSAPSMSARCEIDLSPGTVSVPAMLPPGATR